jgi:hypothetical protein
MLGAGRNVVLRCFPQTRQRCSFLKKRTKKLLFLPCRFLIRANAAALCCAGGLRAEGATHCTALSGVKPLDHRSRPLAHPATAAHFDRPDRESRSSAGTKVFLVLFFQKKNKISVFVSVRCPGYAP